MAKDELLGQFEVHLMLAVVRLGDDAFGVPIRHLLEERTRRRVAMGAVYATLGRLTDKGLVRFRWSDPQPVQGGKARKFFKLTAAGERALRHAADMLGRLQEGLLDFGGDR